MYKPSHAVKKIDLVKNNKKNSKTCEKCNKPGHETNKFWAGGKNISRTILAIKSKLKLSSQLIRLVIRIIVFRILGSLAIEREEVQRRIKEVDLTK